jgi:hypothetical protein
MLNFAASVSEPVLWTTEGDTVRANRDGILFIFTIDSDGGCYFERAVDYYGEDIHPLTVEAMFDSYYEIGVAHGELSTTYE